VAEVVRSAQRNDIAYQLHCRHGRLRGAVCKHIKLKFHGSNFLVADAACLLCLGLVWIPSISCHIGLPWTKFTKYLKINVTFFVKFTCDSLSLII